MPLTALAEPPSPEIHPRDLQHKWIPHIDDREARAELFRWRHAEEISQVYLSGLREPFSVRLRRIGDSICTALIESRTTPGTPPQLRAETEIDPKTYDRYADLYPSLEKLRVTPHSDTTIDWFSRPDRTTAPDPPMVETKSTAYTEAQRRLLGAGRGLMEVTRLPAAQNEHIAHRYQPDRSRRLSPSPQPNPHELAEKFIAEATERRQRQSTRPLVIGVHGRSGSGKTTVTGQIAKIMGEHGFRTTTISTDDYHFGKRRLLYEHDVEEWTNWDASAVYNTASLVQELDQHLQHGEPLPKRSFNFSTEEPEQNGEHRPADVIFVEGLYPHAPELQGLLDHLIHIPTPLATSVGRRILRDVASRANASLGTPDRMLRYYLTYAEPAYQQALARV
jgi:uridine kinase